MSAGLLLFLLGCFFQGVHRPNRFLPSFRGICEVRSSAPGRLRLDLPLCKSKSVLAEQTGKQLLSTGCVKSVHFSPVTGSMLILYDQKQVDAPVLIGAIIKLMGLQDSLHAKENPLFLEKLHMVSDALDRACLDATNGWFDGRLLTGGCLLYAAVYQGMKNGFSLPGTATLLWWASSLLRKGDQTT